MDPKTVDRVTEWEPVTGIGAVDLQSLVGDEFSGAVTTGLAWAFFLNGRVVGVFDGAIEEFVGEDLTAYRAPDPSLPLLFAMRETGGEVRGKYYSKETPLREVDRTLSSGNFTGYVELSENVLSGDYYVVYYGGRSMSVAFVGSSERLVTDDEAFDLADDEVGIYSVTSVDVSVVDLPETVTSGVPEETDDDTAVEDDAEGEGEEPSEQTSVTFGADESTAALDEESSGTNSETSTGRARDADLTGGMGIGLNSGSESSLDTDSAGSLDTDRSDEREEEPSEDAPVTADAETLDTETDADDTVDGDAEGDETDEEDEDETGAIEEGEDETGAIEEGEDETDAIEVDEDETEDEGREEPYEVDTAEERMDGPLAETSTAGTDDTKAAANGGSSIRVDDEEPAETVDEEPAETVDAAPSRPREVVDTADTTAAVGQEESGIFSAERQWQKTRRIPALAPDESLDRDEEEAVVEQADDGAHDRDSDQSVAAVSAEATSTEASDESAGEPAAEPDRPDGQLSADRETTPTATAPPTESAVAQEAKVLEAQLERVKSERDDLASEVESLESDVGSLEADLETVTRERDRLRARAVDLEAELKRLREAADEAAGADSQRLSPTAAREGTNLFVRYRSKGKPTLKKAQSGDAKQDEVVENLRLEYHTTFESETTTVDGEPYESFLYGTTEWQFSTWVVEELLYEIGRSGHRVDLAPLFDRIAKIDRIEFDGTVPVTVEEGEKQSHETRTFDLVFWDSMGDPLFVVDVDTSRNATTQGMVGSLIEGARAVGTSKDTLGGAFYVTTSFFEPGALDAIGEETKSGLLSRSSKKSFVKLSRKQGYHLCLVEARDGEFHLSVPEL